MLNQFILPGRLTFLKKFIRVYARNVVLLFGNIAIFVAKLSALRNKIITNDIVIVYPWLAKR